MVEDIVHKMINVVKNMKEAIKLDIEDVKQANHKALIERNEYKLELIEQISNYQQQLSNELSKELEKGVDVNIYKNIIDKLEEHLKELYELNGKLASIVLPIKQMYSDIISEIQKHTGGKFIEINA